MFRIFLLSIGISLVYTNCIFESPKALFSPGIQENIPCDIPYTIKWTNTIPIGNNLDFDVYRRFDGQYMGTLFSSSINTTNESTNESKNVTFKCSIFNKTLDYTLILIEPTLKYDCRTNYIKIVPCGNGVLDLGEQCDYKNSFRCDQKCQCLPQYYPITSKNNTNLGCCDINCQTNNNLIPNNKTDFSNINIVGGILYILNGYTVYINKNTTIKVKCIENYGTIILNGTNFKSGDIFTPIISNCTVNPKITVIKLPKCITVVQNSVVKGYNTLLKMEFLSDSISSGCLIKSLPSSKFIYIIPVIITTIICVIIIIFILLSIFNNNFKRKVFPWRFHKEILKKKELKIEKLRIEELGTEELRMEELGIKTLKDSEESEELKTLKDSEELDFAIDGESL